MYSIIKVCTDPTWEKIHQNCEKIAIYCTNFGHRIMEINEKNLFKKYVRNAFQVDFKTNESVFPEDLAYDTGYTDAEL